MADRPINVDTTHAAGFRNIDRDPDMVATGRGVMFHGDARTFAGNRASCSTVNIRSERATFVCLDLIRGDVGLYLLLTGDGARAFAASLISAADEADAALAAEADRAMAPILSRKGTGQ